MAGTKFEHLPPAQRRLEFILQFRQDPVQRAGPRL